MPAQKNEKVVPDPKLHPKLQPGPQHGLSPPNIEQALDTVRKTVDSKTVDSKIVDSNESIQGRASALSFASARQFLKTAFRKMTGVAQVAGTSPLPAAATPHKISVKRATGTSDKVSNLLESVQKRVEREQTKPKKHEIDAFHLKSLLLLQQEPTFALPIHECLRYIHTTPIVPSLIEGHKLQLQQLICHFPGEELEVSGIFRRESALSDISIPIKESFQLSLHLYQSGFPHPTQYTGFALCEKLLPEYPLHPELLPQLHKLITLKAELAHSLYPSGRYNRKAKQHLGCRRTLFQKSDDLFFRHKQQIISTFKTVDAQIIEDYFASLASHPARFDELGKTHERINLVSLHAISRIEKEWLLQPHTPALTQTYCQQLLEACIDKITTELLQESPVGRYQYALSKALGQATLSLVLLQLSEHLLFSPPDLSQFEEQLLVSFFRQQLVFGDELHNVPERVSEALFEEYLMEQIEEEIAIFDARFSADSHTAQATLLAEELLHYYGKTRIKNEQS